MGDQRTAIIGGGRGGSRGDGSGDGRPGGRRLAGGATARSGRLRGVLAAIALVGVLAGAFVAWRRLGGSSWTTTGRHWTGSAPSTDAPVPTAAV